ncbi:uncharacterized protein LY89DRAFT_676168 [Mollisia scopiformis]|uniref:Uncharacterized protein n=1 Tax=Mollisia scopiformis TaxID=149040 RepID=A0A132BAD6_MOLSC|nr:uncharacterized protein LY89DRAFT_676168 [Mollisia scopiformis]KUJ09370.1 hypothetical protein LY89DRAFT_676168 [Mollisia scopiformis]
MSSSSVHDPCSDTSPVDALKKLTFSEEMLTDRKEDKGESTSDNDPDMTLSTRPVQAISTLPEPKCYWELLPFELREFIFSELHCSPDDYSASSHWTSPFTWQGSTSPFMKALRTLPKSYDHALQWFGREATLSLTGNPWYPTGYRLSALDISEAELNVVQQIDIDATFIVNCTQDLFEEDGKTVVRFEKPTWFTRQFLDLPSVRNVSIALDLDNIDQGYMAVFLTEWPLWLQGFTALAKVTVKIPLWVMDDRGRKMVNGIIGGINRKTGVRGQFVEVEKDKSLRHVHEDAEVWEWEAVDGKFMDWTQELGREYKYRQCRDSRRDFQFFDDITHTELGFEDGSFFLENWHYCWPPYEGRCDEQ